MKAKLTTFLCAAGTTAALTGVAVAAGSSDPPTPNDGERAAAAARAGEGLPDSRSSLSTAIHSGLRLGLSVAADTARTMPGSDSAPFTAPPPPLNRDTLPLAELGWKAHLIAGVVAERDPQVVEFAVDWPGISPDDSDLMTWRMRTEPGMSLGQFPRLGTATVADTRAQLQSNLDVLESALGTAFERARIVVVPVDAGAQLLGLEADIRVSDFGAVKAHLGDVVNGLATGLVGDDTALIEGLAVNLIADDGHRAGWFRTERTGVGIGISDPALGTTTPPVDADFPNLTGGPPTANSASAGPLGDTSAASSDQTKPKPVSLVPEQGVGPIKLGEKRKDVEAKVGKGKADGDWLAVYHHRHVKLSVSYTTHNRVREVNASGGRLLAYGQALAQRRVASAVLKSHGWTVRRCSNSSTRVAQHASGERFSGVVWHKDKLLDAGVSSIGAIGGCPVGLPVSP